MYVGVKEVCDKMYFFRVIIMQLPYRVLHMYNHDFSLQTLTICNDITVVGVCFGRDVRTWQVSLILVK